MRQLNKSLYGTKDASSNWGAEYRRAMLKLLFVQGTSSPCLFYHPGKDVRVVVYGDDFTVLGKEEYLNLFSSLLRNGKLTIKLGSDRKWVTTRVLGY